MVLFVGKETGIDVDRAPRDGQFPHAGAKLPGEVGEDVESVVGAGTETGAGAGHVDVCCNNWERVDEMMGTWK